MGTLTYRDVNSDHLDDTTRWLHRLRKSYSDPLRYCLVAELGAKAGRYHNHVLLHCTDKLTWRVAHDTWDEGFSHFKLVSKDQAAASYVSKYLSKSAKERIRASRGYGDTWTANTLFTDPQIPLTGGKKAPKSKVPF